MADLYLYEDVPVLRNKLGIKDEKALNLVWRVHPFREGNTRTVVMMMTMFVEHYGYYMDQELMDAVCEEPIQYDEDEIVSSPQEKPCSEKYRKYQKEPYVPEPHYQREDR